MAVLLALVGLTGCWLQPGFDAERAADNPFEVAVSPANVAHLHAVWTSKLDASPAHDPVVVPGEVIVTDPESLYALDLGDGKRVWADVLDPNIAQVGDASINGSSVYVPDLASLATRSFDVGTGREGARVASGDYGTAIVRGTKVVSEASGIGQVHGVGIGVDDLNDPTLDWFSTESIVGIGLPDSPSPTSAAVGSDRFFFGLGGAVVAYPLTPPVCPPSQTPPLPAPCTPLWTANVAFTATFPVLDHGTVYVGTATGVSAIDAATGTVRWSSDLGSVVTQAPAVANGVVYAGTADGRIVALAARGCAGSPCAPLWSSRLGSPISAQPAVGNRVVYTASADGSLHAFAAAGCASARCRPLWTRNAGSEITGAPTIVLGRLIVGTLDGEVIAYGT